MPLIITPYDTLSTMLERKPFSFDNFKSSSQAAVFLLHFITPYHILSSRLERKPFSFDNFKISFQAAVFLLHFITPYHILSSRLERKPFSFANFNIGSQAAVSFHILSRLVTLYHTLSDRIPYVVKKPFSFGSFKISSQAAFCFFITFYHAFSLLDPCSLLLFAPCSQAADLLSYLITLFTPYHAVSPYALGWKENHFHLATLKLVPRLQFFITSYHPLSLLITTYHILSPMLERKPFLFGNFKITSQAVVSLLHLITPCHFLGQLITPYPLGWKGKHFHLAALKFVRKLQILYHIKSYQTVSPTLKKFSKFFD